MTTDPDSILQLGIEAAKDGNKEEARNLFRLLTREDAQNTQAWLWLAGVAESQEERQAALERVVELDPTNDMALKSLQAMQEETEHHHDAGAQPAPTGSPPPDETPIPEPEPPVQSARDRYAEMDFEDPFAELDSLSDVFSEDPEAVRRESTADDSSSDGGHGSNTDSSRSRKDSSFERSSSYSRDDKGSKMSKKTGGLGGAGNPVRIIALGLFSIVLIVVFVLFIWPVLFGGKKEVAKNPPQQPPAATQPAAQPGGDAGTQPGGDAGTQPGGDAGAQPGGDAGAQPGGDAGAQPGGDAGTQPGGDAGTQPGGDAGTNLTPPTPMPGPTATPETPNVVPPEQITGGGNTAAPSAPIDTTNANPQPIAPNTPLESNGWLYDFNQGVCAPFSCSAVWNGNIGTYQPQGRFVNVLVMVENRTGNPQPLPANFLALKDAQGRVYNPLPQVSQAFVIPGQNADLSHVDQIPNDGIARSVALIFDVANDANNLILFAPSRPDQGWQVIP